MTKKMISVGVANKAATAFELEVVKTWEPKNVVISKFIVFFQEGENNYSMNKADYNEIFTKPNQFFTKK